MQRQGNSAGIVRRHGSSPSARQPHNETIDGHRGQEVKGSTRSALCKRRRIRLQGLAAGESWRIGVESYFPRVA